MMKRILKCALEKALDKPAPNEIPLTGERAKRNDFYEIYLTAPKLDWILLISSREAHGYKAWLWVSRKDGRSVTVLPSVLKERDLQLEIIHHYRQYRFDYNHPAMFLLAVVVGRHHFQRFFDVLRQRRFSRRPLVKEERLSLLRELVERTIRVPKTKFSPDSLAVEKYSKLWFHHPERPEHRAHLGFLLDSLVASNDLKKDGFSYKVDPKAMETLSNADTEEQRHQDSLKVAHGAQKLTRWIIFLGVLGLLVRLFIWWQGPYETPNEPLNPTPESNAPAREAPGSGAG